ncbi:MAG: twin-arginine translocase subunit TatC [Magnetococcales bacterium]|nr:twin-arginine translocase subunit TatC [Magnetococcales bacterium]
MTLLVGPEDKAPLIDHLIELRNRLMIAIGVVFILFSLLFSLLFFGSYGDIIFEILMHPLRQVVGPDFRMVYTGLNQAFWTYVKMTAFVSVFIGSPVLLLQLWRFVAPGLYQSEKRAVVPFLILAPLLLCLGGAFAYFMVLPIIFQFYLSFTSPTLEALPSINEYLDLVTDYLFLCGVVFELPVVLLLLIRAGMTSTAKLVQVRRYAIVAIFISAAVVAPDPLSQILMAVPLLALYELTILAGPFMERQRSQVAEQDEEQEL